MNLIFRFIFTIIQCLFVKKKSFLEKSELTFRCFPTDCDINMHMTNSRYLCFMDLGRIHLAAKSGVFKLLFKKGWGAVISGIDITFVKPINPLQKFTLITQTLAWDDKYIYFKQIFMSKDIIYATALARGVFLQQGKKIPVEDLQKMIGDNSPAPEFPEILQQWKELVEIKKNYTSE